MSGLTVERLAELRRIAEAATPGPWRISDDGPADRFVIASAERDHIAETTRGRGVGGTMTWDDVMGLEGRELDAAVAELVLGLRVVECDPVDGRYGPYTAREGHWTRVNGETYPLLDLLPEYSTDIAAAWEVVEHLATPEESITIFPSTYVKGDWIVAVGGAGVVASSKSAPEAICRAALLAALKRSKTKNGGGRRE